MGRYISASGASSLTNTGIIPLNISATKVIRLTGGTETTVGNYKYYTFLTSGTLTVVSAPTGTVLEYLVVGSGGGGGGSSASSNSASGGGGGGAGGYLEYLIGSTPGNDYTGPPLFVTSGDVLTVTVGAGGTAQASSTFTQTTGNYSAIYGTNALIIGYGGGSVGGYSTSQFPAAGGSGGGTQYRIVSGAKSTGIQGSAIVQKYRQGNDGFLVNTTTATYATRGGGAGAANDSSGRTWTPNSTTYAAGGIVITNSVNGAGTAGGNNTGNGGGGAWTNSNGPIAAGGTGGSGIVIIRYQFQ